MASATTSLHAPAFLRWRRERWPRANWARWGLRLVLCVPFVVLADRANAAEGPSLANTALSQRAASLHWSSGQLGWVAHAFPPLPLALARVIPGGGRGLAIAGALCTGIVIHLTIERMRLRSMSVVSAALLTAAVVAAPVFWFVATGDFASLLALGLLSVALTGVLDFTLNRSTESGFVAGICFALAAMCDLAAFPFALAGALAAFFVTPRAHAPREIARRRAAATVVLFPSVTVVAGWAFLQWRFSGSWTTSFTAAEPALFRFPGGVVASLTRAASSVGLDLFFVPLLVAAAALLLTRRPSSVVACLAFVGCLIVDLWIGLEAQGPTAVLLLGLVALALLPERPTRNERLVLFGCVAFQLVIGFVALHHGLEPVSGWFHRVAMARPGGS